jgi:hypothetical protein
MMTTKKMPLRPPRYLEGGYTHIHWSLSLLCLSAISQHSISQIGIGGQRTLIASVHFIRLKVGVGSAFRDDAFHSNWHY